MVNLNKNNTIIENVEYLDMDDPKNSWYFDAERFDVNFPLVCSYKGGEKAALFLHGWFTYWNHVFSYYRRDQDITALLVQRPENSPLVWGPLASLSIFKEACWVIQENLEDPEFLFYLKDSHPGVETYHRFLVGFRVDSFDGSRFEVFKNSPVRKMNFPFDPFVPYDQLIITKDWNLVHRYFNWVYRNHQYEHSKFIYYLEGASELPHIESFKGIAAMTESPISELPKDFRNNPQGFLTRSNNQALKVSDVFGR